MRSHFISCIPLNRSHAHRRCVNRRNQIASYQNSASFWVAVVKTDQHADNTAVFVMDIRSDSCGFAGKWELSIKRNILGGQTQIRLENNGNRIKRRVIRLIPLVNLLRFIDPYINIACACGRCP